MTEPTISLLLVDDRPENLLALEATLDGQGYEFVRAYSGEQALKQIMRRDFALILLDVQMPGLTGFETAAIIKERDKTRDIPIIFLTAFGRDERFIYEGYRVGAVDYLTKPYDPGILKAKVGVFAELYRQKQQLKLQAATMKEQADLLQQANDQLLRADLYKDDFLSVISHELRTPLNFITGFASIMDDEVVGPLSGEQHACLGKILNGAERMLNLVNDLLDFAKIQAEKFLLDVRPLDYAALVDDIAGSLRALAAPRRIALVTEVAVLDPVPMDGARVGQVLTNLISNAIKFTPEGGEILVRAYVEGDMLITEVVDTGIGIAEENLVKVFEKFKQLDMSATRQVGGTGLGLAITKALVEAHGGEIGVRSEEGRGSTFRFALPLVSRALATLPAVGSGSPRSVPSSP
ncbi:MAG: histidine kinase [Cyanobacteria bacterium RYN_339]|nr:histidine kinase [Cyanobacteria bacterium RYN_339]